MGGECVFGGGVSLRVGRYAFWGLRGSEKGDCCLLVVSTLAQSCRVQH